MQKKSQKNLSFLEAGRVDEKKTEGTITMDGGAMLGSDPLTTVLQDVKGVQKQNSVCYQQGPSYPDEAKIKFFPLPFHYCDSTAFILYGVLSKRYLRGDLAAMTLYLNKSWRELEPVRKGELSPNPTPLADSDSPNVIGTMITPIGHLVEQLEKTMTTLISNNPQQQGDVVCYIPLRDPVEDKIDNRHSLSFLVKNFRDEQNRRGKFVGSVFLWEVGICGMWVFVVKSGAIMTMVSSMDCAQTLSMTFLRE